MVYEVDYEKLSQALNILPASAYCIHFPFPTWSSTINISSHFVHDICDLIVSYISHVDFDLYGSFFSFSCYNNILDVSFSISFSFIDFVSVVEVQDE